MTLKLESSVQAALLTALDGHGVSPEKALELTRPDLRLEDLFFAADRVRRRFFGNRVQCCSIVNARSGRCPEDCRFCAQASRYHTSAPVFPLRSGEEILKAASEAQERGARCFGIVTSGPGPDPNEIARIEETLAALRTRPGIRVGASLGILSLETARRLREAGLAMAHHNLETSRRFFPRVCTTHTWEERRRTLDHIKAAGLQLCSGALFGLEETWEDRIALLGELQSIQPDSVPLNFLWPIPGTPLENVPPLRPLEALRIISLARLMLPRTPIKVCGGREACLGDLQSWIFRAGATGTMLGNYLTTPGRPAEQDLRMIEDLGLMLE